MIGKRQIRGLAATRGLAAAGRLSAAGRLAAAAGALTTAVLAVGVLTAAIAGCGAVPAANTANTANTAGTTGTSGINNASAGSTATGCSSVSLATKVTVIRAMHLIEPQRAQALKQTRTDAAKVQALFRDFCQAIAHKDTGTPVLHCPDQIGLSYGGAFFDGGRLLADYMYGASGCQQITVTGPHAKPQTVLVWGTAAAAVPHLETDMAAVLGLPVSEVYQPFGSHVTKNG